MNQVVVINVYFALCFARLQTDCGWIAREFDHTFRLQIIRWLRNGVQRDDVVG